MPWSTVFVWKRKLQHDKESWVDIQRKMGAEGDEMHMFLNNGNSDRGPSLEETRLKEFCRGVSVKDLELRGGHETALNRRAAALLYKYGPHRCGDDPDELTQLECKNPLSAAVLFDTLKTVLKKNNYRDIKWHRLFVADLDPFYVLALAATATYRDCSALRIALHRHIGAETAIGVTTSNPGVHSFQLHLHLAFPILTSSLFSSPQDTDHRRDGSKAHEKSARDLSFLKKGGLGKFTMHWAHLSFVISGISDRQWKCYCFLNGDIKENELLEMMAPEPDEEEEELITVADDDNGSSVAVTEDGLRNEDYFSSENTSEFDLVFDPIANGYIDADVNDIEDAREYYLKMFCLWIKHVVAHWDMLVDMVTCAISEYSNVYFSNDISAEVLGERLEILQQSFTWTGKAMNLIDELLNVLSKTIGQWNIFNANGGAIDNLPIGDGSRYRAALIERFDKLQNHRSTMEFQRNVCHRMHQTIKGHLDLQRNLAANNSGFTSDFTLLVLYPVALAIGLFSMQPAAVPFDVSPKAFVIVMMCLLMAVFLARHMMLNWKKYILTIHPRNNGVYAPATNMEAEVDAINGKCPWLWRLLSWNHWHRTIRAKDEELVV